MLPNNVQVLQNARLFDILLPTTQVIQATSSVCNRQRDLLEDRKLPDRVLHHHHVVVHLDGPFRTLILSSQQKFAIRPRIANAVQNSEIRVMEKVLLVHHHRHTRGCTTTNTACMPALHLA